MLPQPNKKLDAEQQAGSRAEWNILVRVCTILELFQSAEHRRPLPNEQAEHFLLKRTALQVCCHSSNTILELRKFSGKSERVKSNSFRPGAKAKICFKPTFRKSQNPLKTAHSGNIVPDRLTLKLQSVERSLRIFLEIQGFLVKLDQVVGGTLDQTLTVGMQLDRGLGGKVGIIYFFKE